MNIFYFHNSTQLVNLPTDFLLYILPLLFTHCLSLLLCKEREEKYHIKELGGRNRLPLFV